MGVGGYGSVFLAVVSCGLGAPATYQFRLDPQIFLTSEKFSQHSLHPVDCLYYEENIESKLNYYYCLIFEVIDHCIGFSV